MPTKPELVQFGELTPAHFARHPVWISCHIADYDEPWYDETDEETFRPRTGPLPAEATEGMLLARADFVLADGSRLSGFLSPAVEGDPTELLGLMQPQVFLPGGTLGAFWEGRFGRDEPAHLAFYQALGKTPDDVFPMKCSVPDGLVIGISQSVLRGFYTIPDGKTVRVTR